MSDDKWEDYVGKYAHSDTYPSLVRARTKTFPKLYYYVKIGKIHLSHLLRADVANKSK